MFVWGLPNPNFPFLEHLVTIRNHEYVLSLFVSIHTYMKATKRMSKRCLNCMIFGECMGIKAYMVIYLYQNSFVWKYFYSISSWKISNLLCIYRAIVLGRWMILRVIHCWSNNGLEGVEVSIKACNSNHFVFVELSVKNNVGHPSCVIIYDSSLLQEFQCARVPRICAKNHITCFGSLFLGKVWRWTWRASIAVDMLFSWILFTNIVALVWLQWHMMRLYRK